MQQRLTTRINYDPGIVVEVSDSYEDPDQRSALRVQSYRTSVAGRGVLDEAAAG